MRNVIKWDSTAEILTEEILNQTLTSGKAEVKEKKKIQDMINVLIHNIFLYAMNPG